ncbi:cathepsin O isoform X2 [Ambystoma mexicanum]|uniref:cathepsin O isoform X2 n=1 Tax=Ambystoma mexicanum TaxID=8296 RepID=UPI0037E8157F
MTAREGVVADQLTLMLLSLLIRVLPALAVASALLGERAQHEHENPLYNNTERKHDVQKIKEHAEDLFMRLMNEQHGSSPAGSSDYLERKRRFLESVRRQKHLNARARSSGANDTAFYGINQFSDLSPQEFRAIFLRSFTSDNIPVFPVNVYNNAKPAPLPKRFDWRDMNAVTPVKDQQSCGSCWAFSVVEAIESAYAIQSHSLEELSVQQVIDCSEKNLGCNGGSPTTALRWLNQTKVKLVRNSEYNYKAMTGMCHYFAPTDFGVSVKGFEAYNFRMVIQTWTTRFLCPRETPLHLKYDAQQSRITCLELLW